MFTHVFLADFTSFLRFQGLLPPWGKEETGRGLQRLGRWKDGTSASLPHQEALQKTLGMDLRTSVSPLGPWDLLLSLSLCALGSSAHGHLLGKSDFMVY